MKGMIKKALSLVLMAAMLVCVVPSVAKAAVVSGVPQCTCTNPDHDAHEIILSIDGDSVLYYYVDSDGVNIDYDDVSYYIEHFGGCAVGIWYYYHYGDYTSCGICQAPSASSGSSCDSHDLVWKVTTEPTVDADGVSSLICSKCGHVEMQKPVARDAVVYNAFANDLEKQIKKAQPGDTLKLDLKAWHSVPQFLMERIISCGYDVELLYKYQGTKYDITIKNGCGQNLNIPWYGPLLMNSLYGN